MPDAALDRLAEQGFDWVWFLSVWQTGPAAQAISRANPGWRHEFEETLPDLTEADIAGSGFAIQNYAVHRDLGGDAALARLRQRLHARELKLMLDFVPNHMAPDHPWIDEHPDYFIPGSENDLACSPQNYVRVPTAKGPLVLAHGRDPYFDGWPDTLQLNYGHPQLQQAMTAELVRIAGQCDGVRCDMAMLILPDVFESTWGIRTEPSGRRRSHPCAGTIRTSSSWRRSTGIVNGRCSSRGSITPTTNGCTTGSARGTPGRCASISTPVSTIRTSWPASWRTTTSRGRRRRSRQTNTEAAAVLTFLSPGLRFFHQGQFEGRRTRISPHLVRGPEEAIDQRLEQFYVKLLAVLRLPAVHNGQWQLLHCTPAWDGNGSHDGFVCFAWSGAGGERLLVAVNYAPHQGQCYVQLPFAELGNRRWRLHDVIGDVSYDRDGNDLQGCGLYLDEPAWRCRAFTIAEIPALT